MKKLLILAVFLSILCAWPTASRAEGITAGNQLVSGYLGAGAPLQESGIKDAYGNELDWGDAGISYGASYLVFPSAYFGVGAELSGNNFSEAEYDVYTGFRHGKLKTSMNVYNYMLAFRANVNPQSRVRFYIPFGAGLTSAKAKVKGEGMFNDDESATYNSFGYFIGAGLEADLGDSNWILGGEVRYNGFEFDTDKLGSGNEVAGKKDYSYLSVLFKVGYKF